MCFKAICDLIIIALQTAGRIWDTNFFVSGWCSGGPCAQHNLDPAVLFLFLALFARWRSVLWDPLTEEPPHGSPSTPPHPLLRSLQPTAQHRAAFLQFEARISAAANHSNAAPPHSPSCGGSSIITLSCLE